MSRPDGWIRIAVQPGHTTDRAARSASAICGSRSAKAGSARKLAATADDGGMDAEHAAGPCRGRDRLHPEAEQHAGRHHQQHDDVGSRDAGLGILPEQFASKAGRVPLVDVNRSRASRTRCAAARRLATGAAAGVSAGSCTTSGFSAGLLIKQHKSCPQHPAECELLHRLSVPPNS